MKCSQHLELDAVATCNGCNRALCPECAGTFHPPLCATCALNHNRTVASSLWTQLAMTGGLFVVGLMIFVGKQSFGSALLYAAMLGFFPAGWTFLGRFLSPGGGYLFPLARWMNLILHATLAAALGLILGPIQLVKAWQELQTIKATKDSLSKTEP